jgi:hypothetical protein
MGWHTITADDVMVLDGLVESEKPNNRHWVDLAILKNVRRGVGLLAQSSLRNWPRDNN